MSRLRGPRGPARAYISKTRCIMCPARQYSRWCPPVETTDSLVVTLNWEGLSSNPTTSSGRSILGAVIAIRRSRAEVSISVARGKIVIASAAQCMEKNRARLFWCAGEKSFSSALCLVIAFFFVASARPGVVVAFAPRRAFYRCAAAVRSWLCVRYFDEMPIAIASLRAFFLSFFCLFALGCIENAWGLLCWENYLLCSEVDAWNWRVASAWSIMRYLSHREIRWSMRKYVIWNENCCHLEGMYFYRLSCGNLACI